MKIFNIIFTLALLVLLIVGCEDYSAKPAEIHGFELVNKTVTGGNAIVASFTFDCSGDGLVVWWGDEDSDYDAYKQLIANPESDTIVTNSYPSGQSFIDKAIWNNVTITSHRYSAPGDYDVVVIASSVGDFGTDIKQAILKKTITISQE